MLLQSSLIFFGSTLLSLVVVKVFRNIALRLELTDAPDGTRKLQSLAVPKIGGSALVITFSTVLSLFVWINRDLIVWNLLIVLIPALFVSMVGFIDDFKPLSPWLRIIAVALAALLISYWGTGIEFFGFGFLNSLATILWFIIVTNAFNMIDNIDGLCGITTLVSSLGVFVVALFFGQVLVASLAIAISGVSLGFLWHNWHPASIYLGDAGAYFFGFMLAALSIRLRPVEVDILFSWMIPLLILLYPLTDMFYVIVKRLSEKRHIFTPGRDHLSHFLISIGASVPVAAILLGVYSSVGASVAVLVARLL
jgi:UDP-GlcNAc:undecaprenyl-phosphate GlcNAc-1-phosphate transferase